MYEPKYTVIDKFLDLNQEKDTTSNAIEVIRSNTGPGRFDLGQIFEDTPWVSLKTTNQNTQRQFILSFDPILIDDPYLDIVIDYLILRGCNVFFWQSRNFDTATPLADIADFRRKIKNPLAIHPASAEAVKHSLSHQGISSNEFTILDHTIIEYCRYAIRCNSHQIDSANRCYKSSIPKKILYLQLYSAEEWEKIILITDCKSVERVIVDQRYLNDASLTLLQRYLGHAWLEITIMNGNQQKLTRLSQLLEKHKINGSRISIQNTQYRENIIRLNEDSNQYYKGPSELTIDFLNVGKKHLGTNNCLNLKTIEMTSVRFSDLLISCPYVFLNLENLYIPNSPLESFYDLLMLASKSDLSFRQLKRLSMGAINASSSKSLKPELFPALEYLSLQNLHAEAVANLNLIECLKEVEVQYVVIDVYQPPPHFSVISNRSEKKDLLIKKSSSSMSFENAIPSDTDFESLPHLHCLSFNNCLPDNLKSETIAILELDKISNFKLPAMSLPQLTLLKLSNLTTLVELNLSGLSNLKKITICSIKTSERIILPRQLKDLNLYYCHFQFNQLNLVELTELVNLYVNSCEEFPLHLPVTTTLKDIHLNKIEASGDFAALVSLKVLSLDNVTFANNSNVTFNNLPKLHSVNLHNLKTPVQFQNCLQSCDVVIDKVTVRPNNCPNLCIYNGNSSNTLHFADKAAEIERTTDVRSSSVNRLSQYTPNPQRRFDGKFSTPNDIRYQGSAYLSISSSKETLDPSIYRIEIFDHVDLIQGELIFTNSFISGTNLSVSQPEFAIEDLSQETITKVESYSDNTYKAQWMFTLNPAQYYLIPTLNRADAIRHFATDHKDDVEIIFYKPHGACYIRLNPLCNNPIKIKFYYLFVKGSVLEISHDNFYYSKILNDALKEKLRYSDLTPKQKQELSFLYFQMHELERIKRLLSYCKDFEAGSEKNDHTTSSSFDAAIYSLLNQVGVCRHRAEACVMILQFWGVLALLRCNHDHAYIEAFYNKQWHTHDLSGAAPPKVTEKTSLSDFHYDFYRDIPSDHKQLNPFKNKEHSICTSLSQLNSIKYPLILVDSDTSARDIYLSLRVEMNNILFIDNPADIKKHFYALVIHSDGSFSKEAGPLQLFIKSTEPGFIVVNWQNFNDIELAIYKSMIDDPVGTLEGKAFSASIKVIGVMPQDRALSPDFDSRTNKVSYKSKTSERFQSNATSLRCDGSGSSTITAAVSTPLASNSLDLSINLFEQIFDWSDSLIGKPMVIGDKFIFQKGLIKQALEKNQRELIIYNPPKNCPEFDLFLFRLQIERKYFMNGEWVFLPEHFSVKLVTKDFVITPFVEKNLFERVFYLNASNYLLFFDKVVIKDNKIIQEKGYLSDYHPETDLIIYAETLPSHFIARLQAEMQKSKKTFFLKNITQKQNQPFIKSLFKPDVIVKTNDPDFFTDRLIKDPTSDLIVPVNQTTELTDILECIRVKLQSEEKRLHADYSQANAIVALLHNKNIILCGDISQNLYQQLLPLLQYKAGIFLNGQYFPITGSLRLVLPLHSQTKLSYHSPKSIHYQFDDYIQYLIEICKDQSIDLKILESLNRFYIFAGQLRHRGSSMPKALRLNEAKLKLLLKALNDRTLPKRNNPIKSVFHVDYDPKSYHYAYLSVLAKFYFGKDKTTYAPVNLRKLEKLKSELEKEGLSLESLLSEEDRWKVLNCLSPSLIQSLLTTHFVPDQQNAMQIPDILWNKVLEIIRNNKDSFTLSSLTISSTATTLTTAASPSSHTNLPETNSKAKRENELKNALLNKNFPILFLKGKAGIGKTHDINALDNKRLDEKTVKLYSGFSAIEAWINADSKDQMPILFIDEANLYEPECFDFLRQFNTTNRYVYYKGKRYQASENHRVVVTSNPEYYSRKRHYIGLFQDNSYVIRYKAFDDGYLKQQVLKPILAELFKSDASTSCLSSDYISLDYTIDAMIFAFHQAEKLNSYYDYSLRDLNNLAMRFKYEINKHPGINRKQLLFNILSTEFTPGMPELNQREQFNSAILSYLNISLAQTPKPVKITESYLLPSSRKYMVDLIHQYLDLSETSTGFLQYKTCVLLEGSSGIGKSALFKAILEERGLSKISTDPKLKYYEITAGSQNVSETLIKAFHDGSKVILDEVNLDEDLQKLLSQLLCGKDMNNQAPNNPGFMVLGTQNPGYFAGRSGSSKDIRSRCHFIYFDEYTKNDLLEIATELYSLSNDKAHEIVDQFLEAYDGTSVTYRDFYKELSKQKERCILENASLLHQMNYLRTQ